jgi:ubiquitin C-terminal hydrolase
VFEDLVWCFKDFAFSERGDVGFDVVNAHGKGRSGWECTACIIHSGGVGGGHYVAYCKGVDGKWSKYDSMYDEGRLPSCTHLDYKGGEADMNFLKRYCDQ